MAGGAAGRTTQELEELVYVDVARTVVIDLVEQLLELLRRQEDPVAQKDLSQLLRVQLPGAVVVDLQEDVRAFVEDGLPRPRPPASAVCLPTRWARGGAARGGRTAATSNFSFMTADTHGGAVIFVICLRSDAKNCRNI